MTTKHTPGPWKAVRNSSFWEIEPANAGQDGVPFNIGDVCASEPGFPDAGLQEANARLIAAAPDLLEALKAIIINAGYESGEALPQLRELNVSRSCLDAARAALAKAEGKSS